MPPLSSVPSRKGGRAKKKGKERGREQEQAPDDNGDTGDSSNDQNSHNRLSITIPPPSTVILPPSPVPTSTVPSSTSASISAASSSKRKSSALDEGSSLQSASASLAKKQKSHISVSAIDGVKDGLNNISSSIRDMTSERKFCRMDKQTHHIKGAQKASASSPKQEATLLAQQLEKKLGPERMVALVDLFLTNVETAQVYTV
jgi:hypothetical protein